jgi:hypothetical protein
MSFAWKRCISWATVLVGGHEEEAAGFGVVFSLSRLVACTPCRCRYFLIFVFSRSFLS